MVSFLNKMEMRDIMSDTIYTFQQAYMYFIVSNKWISSALFQVYTQFTFS